MVQEQITPVREFLTRRLAALTPREVAQRGIRASVVEARYRGGLITDPVFLQELIRLGYSREEATHRLSAAQLDYDTNLRLELLAAYKDAFRAERISATALHELLTILGVRAELREALVGHELLRRKVEPPPPEEKELRAIGSSTVIRRFREGLTDAPSFAEEMYSLGYEPAEVVRYRVLAELELDAALRLEQVAAYRDGFRAGRLTEGQFRAVLLSIGIDPMATEIYLEHERLRVKVDAPPPEEAALRATGSGVVIRRFREGWTGLEQFRQEMRSLGYTDQEIERYALVATLEFDYDYRQDALNYLRDAYHRRSITADEFLTALGTLGIDRQRALLHLSREQLRLVPPPKAVEPPTLSVTQLAAAFVTAVLSEAAFRAELLERGYSAEDIDIVVATALARLPKPKPEEIPTLTLSDLRGMLALAMIPPSEFRRELVRRGYTEEDAAGLLNLELVRIARRAPPPPPPSLPAYQTALGRLRVAEALALFRDERITVPELRSRLSVQEMPADLVGATVDLEEARKGIPELPPPRVPPPFFETDAGKLWVAQVREAFRRELITATVLLERLIELEMPPEQAEAFVAYEETRKVTPPAE